MAVRRLRLDAELVRRGLARSREHASELVSAGRVRVGGATAGSRRPRSTSPHRSSSTDLGDQDGYVSRGAHKLVGALDAFGVDVAGRRCLDAGASTGGFTDVLLRRGAEHVVAVDVGYGQIAWSLRTDERVTVLERTNVRTLEPGQVAPPPSLVVADLSFISLTLVLPALVRCATPEAEHVLMVKPQFEVGRDALGAGGVVRSAELRAGAVRTVAGAAAAAGLGVLGVAASPLPGPSGNVEYFLHLSAGAPVLAEDDLARALAEGPQAGLA